MAGEPWGGEFMLELWLGCKVPYTEGHNYFVNNSYTEDRLPAATITTREEFDTVFGLSLIHISWYRTRLDREIAARPGLVRASEGQSDPGFEPDLARTFSRGRTEYFFDGRRARVSTPDTPKAVGGFVCRVARSGPGWFELQGGEAFAPGDGICFMYGGRLAGTNVNGTEAVSYTHLDVYKRQHRSSPGRYLVSGRAGRAGCRLSAV